jgi:thiol-disulfide isomerase/thioredoxin
VRVVPCVIILAACLHLTGCSLFQKKGLPPSRSGSETLIPRDDRNAADHSSDIRPTSASEQNGAVLPTSASSGILAGQVIDSSSRPVSEAYILVALPKANGPKQKKPIDVAANSQGYFTIAGLQPGRHYQLTARARDGKRMMAGMTWAAPPNPRVLIRITESFVNKNTPPIPPPPSWPGTTEEKTTPASANNPAEKTAAGETKKNSRPTWQREPAETDTAPRLGNIEVTPEITAPKAPDLERVAEGDRNRSLGTPLEIRAHPRRPAEPSWSPSLPASRVPSCVLVGRQLHNFALHDLDNKVFEFRNRTGKLVLLDFWGTQCMPCLATIPHLKSLQDKYRAAGLQVIGIAYESEGTPEAQRRQVDQVCLNQKINYKVLMGSADCPVKTQLRVQYLPTLILIDENGWIIDQHVGRLTNSQLEGLDEKIQRWLGVARAGR